MYKTVRHGENSLQYTILPQTEEVLNNSGVKGKGRDYSPSIHVRRSRRRSTAKCVLLVTFGIVVALMLAAIPICVMNGALYSSRSPLDHQETTSPPLTPTGREIVKSRKKELKLTPEIVSTLKSKLEAGTSTTTLPTTESSTVASTTLKEVATTPSWAMPAFRAWRSSTSSATKRPAPTNSHEGLPQSGSSSDTVPLIDHYMSLRPRPKDILVRPTLTPETVTTALRYVKQSPPATAKIEDWLVTRKSTTRPPVPTALTSESSKMKDLKDAILSIDDDDDFKQSLEVAEVFSLPPMKPESVGPRDADGDEVTVARAADARWYGARWPFVDTSSYFQWTVSRGRVT